MEFDPRIEKYFDLELNENERTEFLRELELNSDLKAQFDLYGLIIEGIKSEGRLELKEYIKSRVDEESTTTQTNLWFYAAASVTVLLLGYFAIYKYVETGSLKESAEFITLKDEKSDRVKFWKNKKLGKALLPKILFGDKSDSTNADNHWTDSLLAVYSEPNELKADDNVSSSIETPESTDDNLMESDLNRENDNYEMNSKLAVSGAESAAPVMAKPSNAREKSKKPVFEDSLRSERHTISTTRVVAIHLPGTMENKTSSPSKFTIIQQEARNEKPAIESQGSNIFLINMGSESPLIYEIDGVYYLELGPKNIISLKLNAGRTEKPKAITDKKIIEKIQPK